MIYRLVSERERRCLDHRNQKVGKECGKLRKKQRMRVVGYCDRICTHFSLSIHQHDTLGCYR